MQEAVAPKFKTKLSIISQQQPFALCLAQRVLPEASVDMLAKSFAMATAM